MCLYARCVGFNMSIAWPLVVAFFLIILKALFKLYIFHKPDKVDYLKAIATMPFDVSFLIVSLFIKAVTHPVTSIDVLAGLLVIYLVVSFASTILWRISDRAITSELWSQFFWSFPLNAAIASTAFYLAINYVR
jgi:hypothetical protein